MEAYVLPIIGVMHDGHHQEREASHILSIKRNNGKSPTIDLKL